MKLFPQSLLKRITPSSYKRKIAIRDTMKSILHVQGEVVPEQILVGSKMTTIDIFNADFIIHIRIILMESY